MFRSRGNLTVATITWRPLTLVEARGFIEYIVQLYLVSSAKREDGSLIKRVSMNRSRAVFTGLDATSNYEASVGTISLSDMTATGPG